MSKREKYYFPNEVNTILTENPEYKQFLYSRGFLITDRGDLDLSDYPFYGMWEKHLLKGLYYIYIRDNVQYFTFEKNGTLLFLIGHAYDPWDMETDENALLKNLSLLEGTGFWQYEANFTGVYVMGKILPDGTIYHWSDCAGMRISYYGTADGNYYISSHANLVAELCGLCEDSYIRKLKSSRYFHLFGNVLPADLSPYCELRRTVPNHVYCSDGTKKRFFPIQTIEECKDEAAYQKVVEESARILMNSLSLCAEKWRGKKVAISVTGGKDSGVTLASANGNYEQFQYFSYISKPEEAVDAEAAAKICSALGLRHRIFRIPEAENNDTAFELLNEIIKLNTGKIGYIKPNEVRKRLTLIKEQSYDIEIKSWVNEIVRAYWYKKYSVKRFHQRPNGRYLAALYKVFLENRVLYFKTAQVFSRYISEYMTDRDISLVGDWTTLWSWEFGFSAGEGQSLSAEHMLSFDITIPFNNRHLISLMLQPKLNDRIADRLQMDIIKRNNYTQAKLNVNVVNVAHTKKRAWMEKMYLVINSHLPF